MNGRLTLYCPHVPHVTGHAPDPSGYAHSPITFPRLQLEIEAPVKGDRSPKALARSTANASSSTQPSLAIQQPVHAPGQTCSSLAHA